MKEAKSKRNFDDQIDVFIHALHDKTFVYYFDLRETERKIFPRSLADIFTNKKADCKAFALILSKWLRELGYEAFPALVYSGEYDKEWPSVARASETNHAIVLCLLEGKERWIDPTFFFSMGKLIPDHIANRNAIVLDPRNVRVTKIPLPSPEKSIRNNKREIRRIEAENIHVSFSSEDFGASAVDIFSFYFGFSPETVHRAIEDRYSNHVSYKKSEITPFNLVSRKIQDLSYSASFIFDFAEFCKKQDMNQLLPYEESGLDNGKFTWNVQIGSTKLKKIVEINFSSYEQGYYLGRPRTEIEETTIEPVRVENVPKTVHVDTPWFSFTRSFAKENQRLKMKEEVVYKTDRIQNAELKSPAFLQARKSIKIGGVSLTWVSE